MLERKQSRKPMKLLLSLSGLTAILTTAHAQTVQQAQYEIWFLQNMIDHHAQGIQIANLAASRTDNPTVLEAGASLVANDTAEIGTMQSWLSDWYGINYAPTTSAGGTATYLATLSGPAFDYEWTRALTQHERASMAAARAAMQRAWHTDLRSAASSIANTNFSRIQTMRTWVQGGVFGYPTAGPNVSPNMSPWVPGRRAWLGATSIGPSGGSNMAIVGRRALIIGGPNDSSGGNAWVPGRRAWLGSAPAISSTGNGPDVSPSMSPWIPGRRAWLGGGR